MNQDYKIIDNHVHIAGPGDHYKGEMFWSGKFEKGIGFQALKIMKWWPWTKVTDKLMEDVLFKQVRKMKNVDKVTILAFDKAYLPDGRCLDDTGVQSTMYVSNKHVRDLCRKDKRLLFGLSVHPYRDDALEELDEYQDEAVLCKLMPSAHLIDFTDPAAQPKLEKFYRKLAELKLPLLLHVGVETSIPSPLDGYDKFNDPSYIVPALEAGVTVILAHCGCSYFDILQDNVVDAAIRLFEMQKTDKSNWDLYADISAVFSPFRLKKTVGKIFKNIPPDGLIYGSDFPNPGKARGKIFLIPFLRYKKTNLLNRYFKISVNWLKYYFSKEEMDKIFTNFHRLLERLGRDKTVIE
ncbi:amidohydrolase family protein [Bacteroidota bacterium]